MVIQFTNNIQLEANYIIGVGQFKDVLNQYYLKLYLSNGNNIQIYESQITPEGQDALTTMGYKL